MTPEETRREKILKILIKHQFNGHGIEGPNWNKIADEILALPLRCDGCGKPLDNYCEKCQRILES